MTDDRNSAEWLADRAGLARHPNREKWIKACIEVILNARKEAGNVSATESDLPCLTQGVPRTRTPIKRGPK